MYHHKTLLALLRHTFYVTEQILRNLCNLWCKFLLQTPDEIHTFSTLDADHLPLLHVILKESFKQSSSGHWVIKHPISKLLNFLHGVYFLNDVSSEKSASGLKAGQQFCEQALTVTCEASKSDRHANIVIAMLEAGTGVNHADQNLMTPLHHAAESGSIQVIRTLLHHQASVHLQNHRQESCLLLACKHSQWEAATLLFDNGADPFCCDTDKCSPINEAITSHAVELMQHMAARSKKVLEELQIKVTLADAVVFGYDILTSDMQKFSDKEMDSIVTLACDHGNTDVIGRISADLSAQALTAYIERAYNAHQYSCVKELLMKCKTWHGVTCSQISLSDSCESDQLVDLTRLLIKHGEGTNEPNGQPLRTAVIKNNRQAVQHLIDNGAKVNYEYMNNVTPLMLACEESNLDMVDQLLLCGADVNCRGNETPLTICCKQGSWMVLERLLSNKPSPDLNITNREGKTPLEIAEGLCLSAVILHLFDAGNSSLSEHISLNQVCQVRNRCVLESFLQNCSPHQPVEEESLDFVVKNDNLLFMKSILYNNKVTKTSSVLMHTFKTACKFGSSKMVELFIEYDHNIITKCKDNDGNANLHLAIRRQRADLVKLLIVNGYNSNKEHLPMEEVVKSMQVLEILVENGLSRSSVNEALLHVCRGGHGNAESCARYLLDTASANVNHSDKSKVTPLLVATIHSSTTLVELLLSKGAKPDVVDKDQRTPLSVACELQNSEIASRLLHNEGAGGRADPFLPLPPPSDKYPLHVSCMNGFLDIVNLLLSYLDTCDQKDATCSQKFYDLSAGLVQEAHDAGQHEVVRLLLEEGTNAKALHSISIMEACQHGYAEFALSAYCKASTDELLECISEACNNGYDETALSIIINIKDQTKKQQCFDVWEHHDKQSSCSSLQSPSSGSVEENPRREYFTLKYIRADVEEAVKDRKPNKKDNSGKTLLQFCLLHNLIPDVKKLLNCNLIDMKQTDSVGRNVLFYCFNCPRQSIEEEEESMFDYLVKKGAEIESNSFERTLLHECYPTKKGSVQDQLMEKLITHKSLDCNAKDYKEQTPLHIAVLEKNLLKIRKLLAAGSDPHAKDANDFSPFMFSERDPSIYKILRECHPDQNKTMDYPQASKDEDNEKESKKAYFPKGYPVGQRITHSIHTLFEQRNQLTSEAIFKDNETKMQISTERGFTEKFKSFRDSVQSFMKDLGTEIGEHDPLFKFTPTLSGSCSEATKVIEMNEADVLCTFQHDDWKDLKLTNWEKENFTYLKVESKKVSEKLKNKYPQLFNEARLSAHGLFKQFYGLVRKHITGVLKRHKQLFISDVYTILPRDCTICPLNLVWYLNGTWQEFDLDVVPAIHVEKEQLPRRLKCHDLVHDLVDGLVIVPKWTSGLINKDYANAAFQLGFSSTEKKVFYAMPPALTQGYKLAKVIVHDCMHINDIKAGDSISSFMLKCQAFEYFKSTFTTKEDFIKTVKASTARDLIDDEMQPSQDVMKYANEIFKRLQLCMEQYRLESFFLHGSNLIDHATYKEDYRPLLHVKLCRAMLRSPRDDPDSWTLLAEAVVDQLVQPENFEPLDFVQEIEMLWEMGLGVNYPPNNSATILYFMIKNNLVEGVKKCLDRQASVCNIDGENRTAMEVAANNPAIKHVLLEHVAGKIFIWKASKIIQHNISLAWYLI